MENKQVDVKTLVNILNNMKVGDPAIVVNLENARKRSVGAKEVIMNSILKKVDLDVLKKSILGIMLAGTIVVSGYNLVKTFNDPTNMDNLSKDIGGLVSEFKDGETPLSIVSQNTFRNGDVAYYKQDGIAADLLKLDKEIFEYAFCSVCMDMGNSINNNVGVDGKSNIDSVIYYLKKYSSEENGNSYVNDLFRDVESMDDFLVKRGYLDKDGKPSLDMFKLASDVKADEVYEFLQSETKGAKLS